MMRSMVLEFTDDRNTVNITVDTAKPCKVELVGLADTIDIAGSMTYTVTL